MLVAGIILIRKISHTILCSLGFCCVNKPAACLWHFLWFSACTLRAHHRMCSTSAGGKRAFDQSAQCWKGQVKGQTKWLDFNFGLLFSQLLFDMKVPITQRRQQGRTVHPCSRELEPVTTQDVILSFLGESRFKRQLFEFTWCEHCQLSAKRVVKHHVACAVHKLQIQSMANCRWSQAGVAKPRVAYSLLLKTWTC